MSRPLIALLIASVAALAVWMVALKPSTGSGGSGNSSAYQSAIAKARAAVSTSSAASVAHGGTIATTPSGSALTAAAKPAPATAKPAATATTPSAAATRPAVKPASGAAKHKPVSPSLRLNAVSRALRADKVIAMLFYNGAAADDRALKKELAAVPTHGKQVVKLAVPLGELARYPVVTNQVPVDVSPTLVLVDGSHHASTIVGFADRFEIAQRVSAALTVK